MSPAPPPPDPSDPESLARVALLTARWVERLLAGGRPPLTVAQYLALHASAADEDLAGADLARASGVSPAAASQVLAGLEADGLVERVRSPADRRRQTVAPTRAGRAALRSARARLRQPLGALLSELPPPDAHALSRALGRLEAVLTGTAPPRRPAPPPPGRPRPPGRPPRPPTKP